MLYNDTWGTVCNDFFGSTDGEVVCRQLNYVRVKNVATGTFGSGDGPIWLDNVSCSGSESSIQECRNRGFGVHNCEHTEDIGIICGEYSYFDAHVHVVASYIILVTSNNRKQYREDNIMEQTN